MSDFNLEKENFNNNSIMIGVDEAGRGSWAGPSCSSVLLDKFSKLQTITRKY